MFLHDSPRVLWSFVVIDGLIGSGHGVDFSTIDAWSGDSRITSDLSPLAGSWTAVQFLSMFDSVEMYEG